MKNVMDVLFINPGSAKDVYQGLSTDYSGIGTPYWALLLAQSCRSQNYKVGILDILAEQISRDEAVERIKSLNPRLITICVYGENVNSGTTQMSGAVKLASLIKDKGINIPISFVGSHVQALPYKVLEEEPNIDIIFSLYCIPWYSWLLINSPLEVLTRLSSNSLSTPLPLYCNP